MSAIQSTTTGSSAATTIRIFPMTREKLRAISRRLSESKGGRYVGVDETINYIIDSLDNDRSADNQNEQPPFVIVAPGNDS